MSDPKIRPLSDHVLVSRSSAERKSPGGIVIAEVAQEKATRGVVVAVGPGRVTDHGILIACASARR